MIPIVFWLLAAGMLAAAVCAGALRVWLLALIAVTLCWDNLIIAAGASIGAGELLRTLSIPRYVAHAVLTPMLILIVFGVAGLRRRLWVWALTAVLIAVGVWTDLVNMSLEVREYAGTLRYAYAHASPPIPSIVTVVVLIVVGAILWRRQKLPWLCLGALAMFGAAGSGIFWLGNAGELVLISSIVATAALLKSRQNQPASRSALA